MKNVRVIAVLVACIGGASIVFAAPSGFITLYGVSVPSTPVSSRRPSISSPPLTSSSSPGDMRTDVSQSQLRTEGTAIDHNTPGQHSSTADLPSAERTRDDKVPGVHIFHTLEGDDGRPRGAPGSLQVYDISSSYGDYDAPPPPSEPWDPEFHDFFDEYGASLRRGETETTYMNRMIASYFNRRGFGPGLYRSMIEQYGSILHGRSDAHASMKVFKFLDHAELMASGRIPRNNNYGP